MKKILTYTLLLLFSCGFAQKMAYVDTQYILKQMPQYQQSEQRLNDEVKKWQNEIVRQQSALEKLRVGFENDKVLLTDNQQKTRLSLIDSTDKVIHEFIEKKFGSNGESVSLRINLVKPIQDQIWNAINAVAAKDKYNIVFDKSSDLIMIFTDARYDITDKVLKQLGVDGKNKDGVGVKTSNKSNTSKITSDQDMEVIVDETKGSKAKNTNSKASAKEQSKSGYGSKYVPKKQQNKTITKEQDSDQSEEDSIETNSTKTDTKVKKQSAAEVKKTESKTKQSQATETRKIKVSESKQGTTTEQTKSGYGSKYVPKKQQNKTETTEEQANDKNDEDGVGATSTNTKTSVEKQQSTNNKTSNTKTPASKAAENKTSKSKITESKTVDNKSAQNETTETTEAKTTTKTQTKSGYGSKYVPKKKNQNTEETSK